MRVLVHPTANPDSYLDLLGLCSSPLLEDHVVVVCRTEQKDSSKLYEELSFEGIHWVISTCKAGRDGECTVDPILHSLGYTSWTVI